MSDMTKQIINSLEDDPLACAGRMDAPMQSIYAQFRAGAVIGALSTSFAQLIVERGGSNEPLLKALHLFSTAPPYLRTEVRECHANVKTLISSLKRDGFSLSAILWAVMGNILALYRACEFPQDDIDSARDAMIMQINDAQRLSVN